MTEYFEVITNAQTGEVTQRPLTDAEIAELNRPPTAEEQEALRKAAYIAESDPLFFKYQRDEATKDEWLAKIEEIKARYPDPVE
jgi:hypothetical protein